MTKIILRLPSYSPGSNLSTSLLSQILNLIPIWIVKRTIFKNLVWTITNLIFVKEQVNISGKNGLDKWKNKTVKNQFSNVPNNRFRPVQIV